MDRAPRRDIVKLVADLIPAIRHILPSGLVLPCKRPNDLEKEITMGYSAVKFPVKCPICGGEVLFEQSSSAIVDAWLHDQAIRLTSRCHGARWDSTDVERNQIFEYAEAIYATTGKSHFGQS